MRPSEIILLLVLFSTPTSFGNFDLVYDAISDYYLESNVASEIPMLKKMSICWWMTKTSVPEKNMIVSYSAKSKTKTVNQEVQLYVTGNKIGLKLRGYQDLEAGIPSAVQLGKWNSYCALIDPTVKNELKINGKQSVKFQGPPIKGDVSFQAGGKFYVGQNTLSTNPPTFVKDEAFTKGKIHRVTVFDKILSAAEVSDEFHCSNKKASKNIVIRWAIKDWINRNNAVVKMTETDCAKTYLTFGVNEAVEMGVKTQDTVLIPYNTPFPTLNEVTMCATFTVTNQNIGTLFSYGVRSKAKSNFIQMWWQDQRVHVQTKTQHIIPPKLDNIMLNKVFSLCLSVREWNKKEYILIVTTKDMYQFINGTYEPLEGGQVFTVGQDSFEDKIDKHYKLTNFHGSVLNVNVWDRFLMGQIGLRIVSCLGGGPEGNLIAWSKQEWEPNKTPLKIVKLPDQCNGEPPIQKHYTRVGDEISLKKGTILRMDKTPNRASLLLGKLFPSMKSFSACWWMKLNLPKFEKSDKLTEIYYTVFSYSTMGTEDSEILVRYRIDNEGFQVVFFTVHHISFAYQHKDAKIEQDKWSHACVSFDNVNVKALYRFDGKTYPAYMDPFFNAANLAKNYEIQPNGTFSMGHNFFNYRGVELEKQFNGSIKDVGVWDKLLVEDEFKQVSEGKGPEANIVNWSISKWNKVENVELEEPAPEVSTEASTEASTDGQKKKSKKKCVLKKPKVSV